MVAAIGAGGAVGASTGSDGGSQIAALQKQLVAALKQLRDSQAGAQTEASTTEQQLIAARIAALQAQIAQVQAAAAQRSAQQASQAAASAQADTAPTRSPSTLGGMIDTFV